MLGAFHTARTSQSRPQSLRVELVISYETHGIRCSIQQCSANPPYITVQLVGRAAYADRTDDHVAGFQQHAAIQRHSIRNAQERKAAFSLDDVLEGLRVPAKQNGGTRLQGSDLDTADLGVVVAVEQHQVTALIHDCYDEPKALRGRGSFGGRGNSLCGRNC